jgi:hypothetical protein
MAGQPSGREPQPNVLSSDPVPPGPPDFNKPRTAAALMVIGLVIVLSIIDAFSVDFQLDTIQAGLMLGSALLLLGVEAGKRFIR